MTRVKFCGLRSLGDVEAVNRLSPDFAGFVMAPRFWRYVSAETVRVLRGSLRRDITAVGVFVDNNICEVVKILESGTVDMAQLHGSEDESYIRRLQDNGIKVIKAFKVTSPEDVERAKRSPADLLLLDSGTGTGKLFDWSLIEDFGRDYILAGGLTPENVGDAIDKCHPFGVDVSSGIETGRVKDREKMRRFIETVRCKNI